MADTSILEVDIKLDSILDKLQSITEEYNKQSKEQARLNALTGTAGGNIDDLLNAIENQTKLLTDQGKLKKNLDDKESKTAKERIKSAQALKSVLSQTLHITRQLVGLGTGALKMAAFTAIGGGAVGAFGLGGLMSGAADSRYAAHRLNRGESGKLRALQNTFDPILGDSSGILKSILEAQSGSNGNLDAVKIARQLNKTPEDVFNANPADIAAQMMLPIKDLADASRALLGRIDATYMGNFLPQGMANESVNFESYGRKEFEQKTAEYGEKSNKFAIEDETLKSNQDVLKQFGSTKIGIENSFLNVLQDINPELEKFSKVVGDIVSGGIESGEFKKGVEFATQELKKFNAYLHSDESKKDWQNFKHDIHDAGDKLNKFGDGLEKWGIRLGFIEETKAEKDLRELQDEMNRESLSADFAKNQAGDPAVQGVKVIHESAKTGMTAMFSGEMLNDFLEIGKEKLGIKSKAPDLNDSLMKASNKYGFNYNDVDQAFNRASETTGLPKSLLMAQSWHESGGFNPRSLSPAGAVGLGQFMPATAKRFKLTDRTDPVASIDALGQYDKLNLDRFGSIDLMLAAYNAGENAIAKAGNKIPKGKGYDETRKYVPEIARIWAGQASNEGKNMSDIKVKVTAKSKVIVNNQTGMNINTQAVAAGGQ